ncbi:MAG: protocatechuate 3,4-dioxygenase subunit alpha [Pseudomonadota bacterium]
MASTRRRQTPSQTIGPFFAYGLTPEQYGYPFKSLVTSDVAGELTEGQRIRLIGQVLDGKGEPINDAMVEIWQADAKGRFPWERRLDNSRDPGFTGFGRCGTGADPDARFMIDTIKPGVIADGLAPYLNVVLTMRGLLNHLFTRIYFGDETAANADDPVLKKVPAERRATLLAHRDPTAAGIVYRFDIHMQGPNETVFFDM